MNPMDRPDYVKCVRRTVKGFEYERKAWCGREIPRTEFAFVSADHAAENGLAGGRLVACKACREAIAAAMAGSVAAVPEEKDDGGDEAEADHPEERPPGNVEDRIEHRVGRQPDQIAE